ncbi:MAG: hypothetical protein ACF788_01050 [Novipirellula sp. JB048]
MPTIEDLDAATSPVRSGFHLTAIVELERRAIFAEIVSIPERRTEKPVQVGLFGAGLLSDSAR